jgi:hypothetical protein
MNLIKYKCPICEIKPSSHSFQYICIYETILYMYTDPEKSILYDDYSGIINHYYGMLNDIKDKKWSWFFNASQFSQKHYLQIELSIELAKMITRREFSKNLQSILVYKPTWHLNILLSIIKSFLSVDVKNKIIIIDKIPEFLVNNNVFTSLHK